MLGLSELIERSEERVRDLHELTELGLIAKTNDFIPAIHYPPITRYPDITQEEMFKGYVPPADGLMDVYIHIPFCTKRCIFCHYPSKYGAPDSEKDTYLDAMEKEMQIYMKLLGFDKIKLRVALVGGGTPTDLTPKQLERFLKFFTGNCDMSHLRQFNYDIDPHTIIGPEGKERLRILRDYGVDRLTIGVQSLVPETIKRMNRSHDKAGAYEAIRNSMEMGFTTGIEFIFGYPGQTLASWYEELKEMVEIGVHELQFYRLKIQAYGDQQGLIKKEAQIHPDELPSHDDDIRMKQMCIDYLASCGYHENLRRVFTREKKHISLYAFNQCCLLYDQMSFGQTAFSSLHDRFVLNTQSFDEYYAKIAAGRLPFNRGYVRDAEANSRWALALPLKNYWFRKEYFKKFSGGRAIEDTPLYNGIQRLKEYGLVTEDEKTVRLTAKGAFFADECAEFFYDNRFQVWPRDMYADGPLNPYKNNEWKW